MTDLPYQRAHVRRLIQRIAGQPPKRIHMLIGPRQTGKTAIALQARKVLNEFGYGYRFVQMDEPVMDLDAAGSVQFTEDARLRWLVEAWEKARKDARRSERGLVLVVDEFALVPEWSTQVNKLWDADRRESCPLHVVLIRPAPWRKMSGRAADLGERVEPMHVGHWSYAEMAQAFDLTLDEYLFLGGYPGLPGLPLTHERITDWQSHVAESIMMPLICSGLHQTEIVWQLALDDFLARLARDFSGRILEAEHMLELASAEDNVSAASAYFSILSEIGLITCLYQYHPEPQNCFQSPLKINVLNTAFMTAGSGYTMECAKADRSFWSRIVRSAVGAHLNNTMDFSARLYYWRESGSAEEIDFVIAQGSRVVGIEVNTDQSDGRTGLAAFSEQFPQSKALVIGHAGIPLGDFLSYDAECWLGQD